MKMILQLKLSCGLRVTHTHIFAEPKEWIIRNAQYDLLLRRVVRTLATEKPWSLSGFKIINIALVLK